MSAKYKGKSKDVTMKLGRVDVLDAVLAYTSPSVLNPNGKKLTIEEACKKVDVSYLTITKWMKDQPFLREKWDEVLKLRRETMKLHAEKNIEDVLSGDVRLKPREKAEISMRFLEKTSQDYQPKIQMESKSLNLHMDKSIEELEEQLRKYATTTIINQYDDGE